MESDWIVTTRAVLAIALLLVAVYVVGMNWGCLLVSRRNEKLGIDRWHSTAPVVSIVLAAAASVAYPFHPKWWIAIIPALDVATWQLAWWPFALLRSSPNDATSSGPPDGSRLDEPESDEEDHSHTT